MSFVVVTCHHHHHPAVHHHIPFLHSSILVISPFFPFFGIGRRRRKHLGQVRGGEGHFIPSILFFLKIYIKGRWIEEGKGKGRGGEQLKRKPKISSS
jgi:hypothetical protein